MNFLSLCFGITIILLGLLINYFIKFYSYVNQYPPGPKPIPIFGNLLQVIFRRKTHPFFVIQEIGQKYGKLFTFWIGSKPAIIIFDVILGKELYNKFEFCGRPNTSIGLMVSGHDFQSFALMNYGKEVQVLRKVSIEAIRQIISSGEFPAVVNGAVDRFISLIRKEKTGAFSPLVYTKFLILSILAQLTFGHKYEFGDKELNFIGETIELFNSEGVKLILTDFIPITKYILKSTNNNKAEINKLTDLYKRNFYLRLKQYQTGSCDTVFDSLITARTKLIDEGREASNYLTDNNLIGAMSALFAAGTDTSLLTLNWFLLLISYYPDVQQKLRNEVQNQIGNRDPKLSDKINLHYVNAFINEVLRFRTAPAMGFFHATVNQTNIAGYSIPKNTTIFLHQHAIMHDSNYWSEPEKFLPERFLDSNQMLITTRLPAFIPFGTGKRVCVGERLAFDMEFLLLSRLLQATNGYQFELAGDKRGVDLIPESSGLFVHPKPYNICLKMNTFKQ